MKLKLLMTLLISATAWQVQAKPSWAEHSEKHPKHSQHDHDHQGHSHKGQKGKHNYAHNNLPYGLQKKLARTGTLPPGWQKKTNGQYYLSSSYITKDNVIKTVGDGVIQVKVNNDVLTVIEATRQIIGVLSK